MLSMWCLGVGGAWLLGVQLGLGLVGVWIAMASDEWLRGVAMLLRWRSGVWRRLALVDPPAGAAVAAVAVLELEEGL